MTDTQLTQDEHVWQYTYGFNEFAYQQNIKHFTNREALGFLGISPENFDILTSRNSPDMEKEFLLSAIRMFSYYSLPHMFRWLEVAIQLSSMAEYQFNENFKEVIDSVSGYSPSRSKKASPITQAVRQAVSIPEIAKDFGLEFNKRNKISCPFHADGTPSLVYYPKTNSFFCFGCRASGDNIEFYRRLNEVRANGS